MKQLRRTADIIFEHIHMIPSRIKELKRELKNTNALFAEKQSL